MKPPLRAGSPNDFQTPPIAIHPLFQYLRKDWIVWECASTNEFTKNGYRVIESDIKNGKNFLDWKPDQFDCIVTNPPFSIKQEFIERAYEIGKPFAFLLPLTTLATAKRQALFQQYGIEIILFDKRLHFETPNKVTDSKSWFDTAWFTWGLNIGSQLSFIKYKDLIEYQNQTEVDLT
jgi:hypothetical protein